MISPLSQLIILLSGIIIPFLSISYLIHLIFFVVLSVFLVI